jgi:hypothetical protein
VSDRIYSLSLKNRDIMSDKVFSIAHGLELAKNGLARLHLGPDSDDSG